MRLCKALTTHCPYPIKRYRSVYIGPAMVRKVLAKSSSVMILEIIPPPFKHNKEPNRILILQDYYEEYDGGIEAQHISIAIRCPNDETYTWEHYLEHEAGSAGETMSL